MERRMFAARAALRRRPPFPALMPTRLLSLLAVALLLAPALRAQDTTPYFSVEIEELTRANAPALHSAAVAQHDGLWLFVTGRTNGLHAITGGSDAFPNEFANGAVVVYDPDADQRWTASLDALPEALADPLRTTNAQFHQDGETLYVVGGYGHDSATGAKTTFGTLTALAVPGLIGAVQNGTALAPHLRQLADARLAVTGGHLAELDGRYILAGGNFFSGDYLAASQVQIYTDALRYFDIEDDGTTLALANYSETVDADRLHRRDGNLGPVIRADGSEALALFGGVFQTDANLPFRTPVYFDDAAVDEAPFEAQFGHYTAPLLPLYDAATETMHTVFFGGMGQYYVDETGTVTEDLLVPFVDAVSILSTNSDATVEHVLDTRMPGRLGTNAAFFLDPSLPTYTNGVIRLRDLGGRTRVGYIHGGIETDTPHPGFFGGASWASTRVFAVYVTALPVSVEHEQPADFAVLPAAPNPFRSEAHLAVRLDRPQPLRVEVFDLVGRRLAVLHDGALAAGPHTFTLDGADWPAGVYLARVTGERGTVTQRLARLR